MFTKAESMMLLDEEIVRVAKCMKEKDAASNEYNALLQHLEKLYRVKNECDEHCLKQEQCEYERHQKVENDKKIKIDWNVLIAAGFSLLEIILILKHERLEIVSSKALNFVKKVF